MIDFLRYTPPMPVESMASTTYATVQTCLDCGAFIFAPGQVLDGRIGRWVDARELHDEWHQRAEPEPKS